MSHQIKYQITKPIKLNANDCPIVALHKSETEKAIIVTISADILLNLFIVT